MVPVGQQKTLVHAHRVGGTYDTMCGSRSTHLSIWSLRRVTCRACRSKIVAIQPDIRWSRTPALNREFGSSQNPFVTITSGMAVDRYLQQFRDDEFRRLKQWMAREGLTSDLPSRGITQDDRQEERSILLHSNIVPAPSRVWAHGGTSRRRRKK